MLRNFPKEADPPPEPPVVHATPPPAVAPAPAAVAADLTPESVAAVIRSLGTGIFESTPAAIPPLLVFMSTAFTQPGVEADAFCTALDLGATLLGTPAVAARFDLSDEALWTPAVDRILALQSVLSDVSDHAREFFAALCRFGETEVFEAVLERMLEVFEGMDECGKAIIARMLFWLTAEFGGCPDAIADAMAELIQRMADQEGFESLLALAEEADAPPPWLKPLLFRLAIVDSLPSDKTTLQFCWTGVTWVIKEQANEWIKVRSTHGIVNPELVAAIEDFAGQAVSGE
jgi:hypothetical protein